MNAVVRGVEYQGSHYQIALQGGSASDLTALVDDAAFAAAPLAAGDEVALAWADADIHPLSPAP
jgi:putative spermidine/putrescine transport system ATP-binding protein